MPDTEKRHGNWVNEFAAFRCSVVYTMK